MNNKLQFIKISDDIWSVKYDGHCILDIFGDARPDIHDPLLEHIRFVIYKKYEINISMEQIVEAYKNRDSFSERNERNEI